MGNCFSPLTLSFLQQNAEHHHNTDHSQATFKPTSAVNYLCIIYQLTSFYDSVVYVHCLMCCGAFKHVCFIHVRNRLTYDSNLGPNIADSPVFWWDNIPVFPLVYV
jgi:hypothetical protein